MTDLQLAREKQQNFDEWKGQRARSLPIDLTVTVLTTGFWPSYKVQACCGQWCVLLANSALDEGFFVHECTCFSPVASGSQELLFACEP